MLDVIPETQEAVNPAVRPEAQPGASAGWRWTCRVVACDGRGLRKRRPYIRTDNSEMRPAQPEKFS